MKGPTAKVDWAQEKFDKLDARTKCEFLAICMRDLTEAANAIELLDTNFGLPEFYKGPIRRCIAESAIVRYSRPFFESTVKEEVKQKLPVSFRCRLSAEQEALHLRIYKARCSLVGHSDLAFIELHQFRIKWKNEQPIFSGLKSQFESEKIVGLEGMKELISELHASINWSLQHFAKEVGEFVTPSKEMHP
jgi:hypothetical protein